MTTLDHDDIDDDDDDDNDDIDDEEIIRTTQQVFQTVSQQQQQHQQQLLQSQAGLTGKTIVASDNDVTNGFVKDGKMLPYVFEATEAGKWFKVLSLKSWLSAH